jgi:hypothetical protein
LIKLNKKLKTLEERELSVIKHKGIEISPFVITGISPSYHL